MAQYMYPPGGGERTQVEAWDVTYSSGWWTAAPYNDGLMRWVRISALTATLPRMWRAYWVVFTT